MADAMRDKDWTVNPYFHYGLRIALRGDRNRNTIGVSTPCLKKNCASVIFWITPWNIGRL